MQEPNAPPTEAPDGAQPTEEHDRAAQPVDLEEPPRVPFPIVGIGASAGGLEAFTEFFKAMPASSGMAFVLIQHLPPDRESMIAEILARHTQMPVAQVVEGVKVEPDHVYVIRPGHTLTIQEGVLHLGEPVERPRHTRPVDDFFKSLAEEQRERAICIIMSGMGSNGTAGTQAIKAVGGLCIAQEPDEAQFPSMPRHLIDAGYADYILPCAMMPEILIGFSSHPYSTDRGSAESLLSREQRHMREILAILRTRTQQDFAGYKKPTLLRRVQRRMGLHRLTEMAAYVRFLRQSPNEASSLADDLLIHVTGFFRDTFAWDMLRQRVIAPLVAEREAGAAVRCWVTACSSGEEAYSLAMMLVEECERVNKPLEIKIFATDTAERTLGNARNGVYPGGIEGEMPPERLARFFEREDAVYRVRQDLRERVVFAPQNLLQDPPFSRLDIISCRNLLIYLEPDIQRHVLGILHFGLREGGTLFLGTSETIGSADDLFEPLDKKARLFRRIGPSRAGSTEIPLPRGITSAVESFRSDARTAVRPSIAALTSKALLTRHVSAAVTVDRNYRIVFFHGDTYLYVNQPSGEPTRNLMTLAAEPVRGAVRTALQRAMSENRTVSVAAGRIETPHGEHRIVVTASPLEQKEEPDFFVVSFDPHEVPHEPAAGNGDGNGNRRDQSELNEELHRVREELQSTIEELQTSNEEHKASSEEVMSINEELQSSNEELETSKEEMQSLNEELTTVNAQLQAKIEEYQGLSNDLTSLLSSTDIAVIFLDTQFRIRRFTAAAVKLMELIGSDVGRPLSDLARKFVDAELLKDAQHVLDYLAPIEREVRADDGRWYTRRVLPYRTQDNHIDGVVITFIDITSRKNADEIIRQSEEQFRVMVESIRDFSMFMIDPDGRISAWNASAEAMFEWTASEAVGRNFAMIFEPQDRENGAPEHEIRQAMDHNRAIDERWHLTRSGRRFWASGALTAVRGAVGELRGFVKVLRDETQRRKTQELLETAKLASERANEMKDVFLATLGHELRTPLSAILLWSRVLRDSPNDAAQVKEGLQAIVVSAEAQRALVEDMLDTSSIATGKMRLELVRLNVSALVRSAVEAIVPTATVRQVSIDTRVPKHSATVRGDEARLRQVLWNLLTNAVKFTPAGGNVRVEVSTKKNTVLISVADTGEGISPEFLPFVFDRFRQYEGSITRTHGGLGLGLAIAKKLIELHGGTINVHSPGLGKGATFTLTLPLAAASTSDTAAPSGSDIANRLKGVNVLLVEDDDATRLAIERVLQHAGAQLTATATAAQAFNHFSRSRPDLFISDIGLPDMDGYALLAKIRTLETTRKAAPVPTLALTAYARDEDRAKSMQAGFQQFLAKPAEPEKLVEILASMLPAADSAER